MKGNVSKAKILVLLLIILFYSESFAQGTVGGMILATKELNKITKERIEDFDGKISQQQQNFYANAYNFSSFWLKEFETQVDNIDETLTGQQVAAFGDIQRLLNEAKKPIDKLTMKTEDVSLLMANTATRLIGSNDSPAPTFYNLPRITESQNKTVKIIIKGVNLDHEDNYIVFHGKKIMDKSIESPQKITFQVSLTSQDKFEPFELNTFELHLFENNYIFWKKEHTFNPAFVVLPNLLANAEITYISKYKVREESKEYAVQGYKRTSRNKVVTYPFKIEVPIKRFSEGWKIIKDSPRYVKAKGDGDEHYCEGPRAITEQSFYVDIKVRDGTSRCDCYWREYRELEIDSTHVYMDKIYYGPKKIYALPEEFESLFQVKLTFPDGEEVVSGDSSFTYKFVTYSLKINENKFEIGYDH